MERWTPYQIRNLTATEVRVALDLESSQALLGHSKSLMTEHDAVIKESKAVLSRAHWLCRLANRVSLLSREKPCHRLSRGIGLPSNTLGPSFSLVRGKHVEHWLNGEKLLEYDINSRRWKAYVKTSKWFETAYGRGNWGLAEKGHIGLQDYGGAIEFRSIKIRPLR